MFSTPEHLHLALNHAPLALVPCAALVTAWGLLRRNAGTVRTGLVLLAGGATLTAGVMLTGDLAAQKYLGADVLDSGGFRLMSEHERQAGSSALATYVAGALALAALTVGFFREKIGRALALLAVLGAATGFALSVRTAESGAKIRRPDFRPPEEKQDFGTLKRGMAEDFAQLSQNVGETAKRAENRALVKALREKTALCALHTPRAAAGIEPESARADFIAAYKSFLSVFDDALRRADVALAEGDFQAAMAATEECKALIREGHGLFMKH